MMAMSGRVAAMVAAAAGIAAAAQAQNAGTMAARIMAPIAERMGRTLVATKSTNDPRPGRALLSMPTKVAHGSFEVVSALASAITPLTAGMSTVLVRSVSSGSRAFTIMIRTVSIDPLSESQANAKVLFLTAACSAAVPAAVIAWPIASKPLAPASAINAAARYASLPKMALSAAVFSSSERPARLSWRIWATAPMSFI